MKILSEPNMRVATHFYFSQINYIKINYIIMDMLFK